MNAEKFIIDDRFTADAGRNLVCDKKSNTETRLEPRLFRLLSILIEKQGEVVTRKFLIKEIWDNYLGANEGLNQAISFLRKLLDDGEKKMIRTLPKKGYSFHAIISIPSEMKTPGLRLFRVKRILPVAISISLCIGGYFLIRDIATSSTNKQMPVDNSLKEMSERDAENKSVLLFSTDTLQQAGKNM